MLKNLKAEVVAAGAGASGGGAISGFVLWLLGVLFWHVPADAAHATEAVAAVPLPVIFALGVVLPAVGAVLGGHKLPVASRPVDPPVSSGPGAQFLSGLFSAPVPPQRPVGAVSVPVADSGDVPLSPGDVTSHAAPATDAATPEAVVAAPTVPVGSFDPPAPA